MWRRAEDRFRRAVDRYHQVLEQVEVASEAGSRDEVRATSDPSTGIAGSAPVATPDLTALESTGARQADLLARVHEVCLAAHALAPSEGEDIPPGPGGMLLDVHRGVARAATLVAQSAESVTMVLVTQRAGRPEEEAAAATLAAGRATEQAGPMSPKPRPSSKAWAQGPRTLTMAVPPSEHGDLLASVGGACWDCGVVGVALRRPLRRNVEPDATWTSALERYRRAVARYSLNMRDMPDRALRGDLMQLAGPLQAVLEDFEDAFANRRTLQPGRDTEVLALMHRAATLCAHATEAALMANEAAWRDDNKDVMRNVDAVRSLVKKIDELGDEANPQRS